MQWLYVCKYVDILMQACKYVLMFQMDADYCEEDVEICVPGKKRKHMSKFKRIMKKKKPKFDPG